MEIKIQQQLETNNLIGDLDTKTASIDKSSMPFVFDMLSKSLYSNPIGAICREITSNCFDSHKEAGVTDYVKIIHGRDEEGYFIIFKDVGVGLSPERISNIYMNYFSSTKRDTNDLIGGFGLGSKTPLAYQDYFYINTVFNNKKYNYIFSKGETLPTLDLLETLDTSERNGTEIKIIIKNIGDVNLFRQELIKQCNYFDDVIFENWGINNDYKIYDLNTFKIRNFDSYSNEIHVLLGKVAYPVNWELISEYTEDILSIEIPIAVKFEIGEFQVTPNRETIRYTEETKKLIGERIKAAYDEFISIYESQTKPYDNVYDYLLNIKAKKYIKFLEDEIPVPQEISKTRKSLCTVFNDINHLYYLKERLLSKLYKNSFNNSYGKETKYRNSDLNINTLVYKYFTTNLYNNKSKCWKYPNAEVYTRLKFTSSIDYVKTNDSLFFRSLSNKKRNLSDDYFYTNSDIYFNLGIGIKLYKTLKIIRSQLEEKFKKYDDLTFEELQQFKKYKKDNDAAYQRKINNKFIIKHISSGLSQEIKEKSLNKKTSIIVYGFRDDKNKLETAYQYFCSFPTLLKEKGRLDYKKINIITISKQSEKHFLNKKNMTHVDNIYGDNKLFRKFASMLKIKQILADNSKHLSEDLIKSYSKLSTELSNNLKTLKEYHDKYKLANDCYYFDVLDNNIRNTLLKTAEEKNLFDPLITPTIELVENWFKGIEIIKYTDINDESLPYLLKYLKQNNKKLNLEYYQKYIDIIEAPKNKTKQLTLTFVEEYNETKFQIITKNVA